MGRPKKINFEKQLDVLLEAVTNNILLEHARAVLNASEYWPNHSTVYVWLEQRISNFGKSRWANATNTQLGHPGLLPYPAVEVETTTLLVVVVDDDDDEMRMMNASKTNHW